MAIPFVDLKRQSEGIEEELLRVIKEVSLSGQYILGPQLEKFEREMSQFLEVSHCIGVASGTEAIFLALKALGIGAGDEVITTPFSFIAGVETILAVGAAPVFADIDPKTFNIDPRSVETRITSKTKAVLAVHLFGIPADLGALQLICRKNKLFLIEDACQAFGSRYRGKPVGTFGEIGCFSFYPTKNLGGFGDSGMAVTLDDEIAVKIKVMRNHGSLNGEEPYSLGWNSRLDEIQAAVLRVKLKHVEQWNQERRLLAQTYRQNLSGTEVVCPDPTPDTEPTYHNFAIRSERRNTIREALTQAEIGTMIYYPKPLYEIPAVRRALSSPYPHLGEVEKICKEVLALPLYPGLTKPEIEKICQIVGDVTK